LQRSFRRGEISGVSHSCRRLHPIARNLLLAAYGTAASRGIVEDANPQSASKRLFCLSWVFSQRIGA
jgi:hypothetical protein